MMINFDAAFNRDQCAFFNPSIKNGGPDPTLKAGHRRPRNENAKRDLIKASGFKHSFLSKTCVQVLMEHKSVEFSFDDCPKIDAM